MLLLLPVCVFFVSKGGDGVVIFFLFWWIEVFDHFRNQKKTQTIETKKSAAWHYLRRAFAGDGGAPPLQLVPGPLGGHGKPLGKQEIVLESTTVLDTNPRVQLADSLASTTGAAASEDGVVVAIAIVVAVLPTTRGLAGGVCRCRWCRGFANPAADDAAGAVVDVFRHDPFVEVPGPAPEPWPEVRPGGSPPPLFFVPLAVDANLARVEGMVADGKDLLALGVNHPRETTRFEGEKLDGVFTSVAVAVAAVEQIDRPHAERPAQVYAQDYHRVFGRVREVVLSDMFELPRRF